MTTVIVCGSRNFRAGDRLFRVLDAMHAEKPFNLLVEGGERTVDKDTGETIGGADYFAWRWAVERNVRHARCDAEWGNITRPGAVVRYRMGGEAYDAAAGPVRNQRMLDEYRPDRVIAFSGPLARWGRGTMDMVRKAEAAGIRPTRIEIF